jgi:hypothetical protein
MPLIKKVRKLTFLNCVEFCVSRDGKDRLQLIETPEKSTWIKAHSKIKGKIGCI